MKKILFLFLLVFLLSCEKQKEATTPVPEKFCWTCEFYYPTYRYRNWQPSTIRRVVCEKTEDEIRSYEKEMSYYTPPDNHTVTCWKKY